MADSKKKLASKFLIENRYKNFGPCLRGITVKGFRGIDVEIHFHYPVTAITGLNGAGKSTIGQLTLCGYKRISTELSAKRFYVKDFFPVSIADPSPFLVDASVIYNYETDDHMAPQELTVSRAQKEWSGYKRQPERHVEYIGLAFYIPKVERKDLTIYSASSLKLLEREDLENAGAFVSRILGGNYEDIFFQGVESSTRKAQLGIAKRLGAQYSENNMGFGEGRVIHAIKVLETCPEQSLIVLEEPETSLHEHAQYEFSKYLVDVSLRRGHQIIFSSHSSTMLTALPDDARKMLHRDHDGVKVYDHLSSAQIRSALSSGRSGKVIVCVEDGFARTFLQEILRKSNQDLMKILDVIPFGDAVAVKNAVSVLRSANIKCFAVRDADQGENLAEGLLKFPGALAPEKEVFLSDSSKNELKKSYGFDLDAYLAAHPQTDHHSYSRIASDQSAFALQVIEADCIRAFLAAQPVDWASDLIEKIKLQSA